MSSGIIISIVSTTVFSICVMMTVGTVALSMIFTLDGTKVVELFYAGIMLVAYKYMYFSLCYLMVLTSAVVVDGMMTMLAYKSRLNMDKDCYVIGKHAVLTAHLISSNNDDGPKKLDDDGKHGDDMHTDIAECGSTSASDVSQKNIGDDDKPSDSAPATQIEITECVSTSATT